MAPSAISAQRSGQVCARWESQLSSSIGETSYEKRGCAIVAMQCPGHTKTHPRASSCTRRSSGGRRPSTRTSSTTAPRGSPGSRSTGPRSATPFGRRRSRSCATRSPARATTPASAAIVFTGAGDDAFCAGGDQRIRGDDGYIGDDDVAQQGVGRLDVGDLHVQIRRLPKPVLAAVAGLCGRRRSDPAPGLRSVDRGRQRRASARPGRGSAASTAASAPGCWRARWACARRRRSGSCAASTTPQEALEMGLVNAVVPLDRARARVRSPGAGRCTRSRRCRCGC